ncbi:MAG TPA: hypothetical protein VGD37_21290 [Kofleriaceae bacterium]
MPQQPPRFLPTAALAVLWVVLYLVWVAVRPTPPATTTSTTRPAGRSAATTTTTTVPPLFKFKP